jgi:hypothetical protein
MLDAVRFSDEIGCVRVGRVLRSGDGSDLMQQ